MTNFLMIQPVFLWTDILIYLLLSMVLLYVMLVLRHDHLAAPWRHVKKSKVGMATAVVLLAYVCVGVLDSIHFRLQLDQQNSDEAVYAVEVISVLDVLLKDVKEQQEKTYSAPLATHLYSRETVSGEGRVFPRLKYGGAHLADPERDFRADITVILVAALFKALLLWLGLVLLLLLLLRRSYRISLFEVTRRMVRFELDAPWHVALISLAVLCIFGAVCFGLSANYHLFGTDKVGMDVFYMTLKSMRTGLIIGTLTTLIMLPFAVILGISAGYFRGVVDDVIQYIYTTLSSIPGVLLIAAAILGVQIFINNNPQMFDSIVMRADARLLALCAILGISSWAGLCRMLRAETLKLRELEYIQSATSFGVSHGRILLQHVLPNMMHIVLITVVLDFSGLVLAEAVLSYVGVGVDPSTHSWGNMINTARLEMAREPIVWWPIVAAFSFMLVLILAANLFADVVRDAFDPKTQLK